MIQELFDVQGLIHDFDFDEKRTIVDPEIDLFDYFPSYTLVGNDQWVGDFIASHIESPVSGEIYLITDKNFFKKIFALYVKSEGINWAKILCVIDENVGEATEYAIAESSYQALRQTPIFAADPSDHELGLFIGAQGYTIAGHGDIKLDATNSNEFCNGAVPYLNKGLWLIAVGPSGDVNKPGDAFDYNSLPVKEKFTSDAFLFTTEMFGETLLVQKPEDIHQPGYIVGSYPTIKRLYCTGTNRKCMIMGGAMVGSKVVAALLGGYDKLVLNPLIEKEERLEQNLIEEQIPTNLTPSQKEEVIERHEGQWDDEMAEVMEQIKGNGKRKKPVSKKFEVESEISVQERALAVNESVKEAGQTTIKVPKRNKNLSRIPIEIGKTKEQLESATELTFPDDWDYVYSVAETSAMYNLTIGRRYDPSRKDWLNDSEQKEGMSIEEWNAFFFANPQYSHLIPDSIGQWGGLKMTEQELLSSGALLYNPLSKKLEYAHHYLKGNAYDRYDETIAAKDFIVSVYSVEFYNRQLEVIKQATPAELRVDDPDVERRPFIHPLDDINASILIKFGAGTSFPKRLNPKLMAAYKKAALAQRKARKGKQATQEQDDQKEMIDLEQPQELSILIFFKKWLSESTSYHIKYDVPVPREIGSEFIDAVEEFYFGSRGFKQFASWAVSKKYWNMTNPATGVPFASEEEVTRSDFFEFRDNLKAMVNTAFQDFILEEISSDDREKINRSFNRRYNGFIKIDVHKYPVFIRHRKYFKDRMKRIVFKLDESQVNGMKFGTINNSSIMAHEVGYGKTSLSIGYMSHMFETNQASNILVAVPKSLYDNKKWKEEIAGYIDAKRDQYILGISPPDYNLIELGNLTPTTILDGAKTDLKDGKRSSKVLVRNSSYKTYSFDDVARIEDFRELHNRTIDTASPSDTDPYAIADSIAKKNGWSDVILEAKNMDVALYQRCKSSAGEFFERVLDIFDKTSNKFWETKESKRHRQIVNIGENILYFHYMMESQRDGGPNLNKDIMTILDLKQQIEQITGNKSKEKELEELKKQLSFATSDVDAVKEFEAFQKRHLDFYLRDDNGKIIYEVAGGTRSAKYREVYLAYEDYLLEIAEETFDWVITTLKKMNEYGVYEYGKWNLSIGAKNIFLITHDALKRLGFNNEAKEFIRNSIHEFSSYKESSVSAEEDDTATEIIESATEGETLHGKKKRVFHRDQKKAIEKQYDVILSRVNENMTTDGTIGKLMMDALAIDGFVFDEGHKGNKLFTNAVSDSVFDIKDEKGRKFKIRKSSHDISGGNPSDIGIQMFGVCQYMRSLGPTKPVMILTATPFGNQPTQIFTMTAMVGVKQLREQGIANVKNFFDLFLNETLKYSFDHNGKFVKRITVEDFRNKPLLLNVIWSVMDIKREASRDASSKSAGVRSANVKPEAIILPKLTSASSYDVSNAKTIKESEQRDKEKDCEDFKNIANDTTPELKRDGMFTSSIVNRNSIQEKIMEDLEKVALALPNPKKPVLDDKKQPVLVDDGFGNLIPKYHPYTFDDICPNIEIMVETDRITQERKESDEELSEAVAKEVDSATIGSNVTNRSEKKVNEGRVFKTLGISQAVCLSPYFYSCQDLPAPSPENLIKLSPKIEYLVKAIASVKEYHIKEIPKQIKDTEDEIEKLEKKGKLTLDEVKRLESLRDKLPRLKAATKVSGQVVYLNKVRFHYYRRDKNGKAIRETHNLVGLIRDYMVDKGMFTREEIGYVGTGMKDFSRVKKDDVETTIKDFQEGKVKVLFGTPAIKEGVDLQQNGSVLYVMTPDWNPTDMRQIEGRIWRRGNPYHKVRVVYVLLDQSVEIFIYAKLEEKAMRLKRIMKERNELLEMQEMSLDPREAQIALASDPGRRADIITKTCHEILKERRNRLRVSVETLAQYAEQAEVIEQNVEDFYNQYMLPYWEETVRLQRQVVDMYIRDAAAELAANKDKFVRLFCNNYDVTYAVTSGQEFAQRAGQQVVNKVQNNKLLMGMNIIANGSSEEYNLRLIKNIAFSPDMVMEYLAVLKIIIDNKDKFIDPTSNKLALVDSLLPMSYVQSLQERNLARNEAIRGLPIDGGYWGTNIPFSTSLRGEVFLLSGGSVLCLPSHLQKKLAAAITDIINHKGKFNRQEFMDLLRPVLQEIVRDMTGLVYADDFVKPENTKQVIGERKDLEDYENTLKDLQNDFRKRDIFDQAKDIKTFYENKVEKGIIPSWNKTADRVARGLILRGSAALSRRSARDFESIMPAMIAPILGLASSEEKDADLSGIAESYTPIGQIAVKAKEIRNNLEMIGYSTDDKLHEIVSEGREKLDRLETAILGIKQSRDELYVKFSSELEAKKKISIDDIIRGFSQLNYILADREPEMH